MQELTPLMQQYQTIRSQYPDTLLMFQVGDFYELFFDDAKQASAALGITLTSRGKNKGEPIPLCGVPLHALDYYLVKLVKQGFKVAICDQLETPTPGKIVERGVTKVLTPGTLTDTKLLNDKTASYLFSFFPTTDSYGLIFGEILTAQLFATVLPAQADRALDAELVRFFPDEVLVPSSSLGKSFAAFFKKRGYFTTYVDKAVEESDEAHIVDAWITQQFRGSIVEKIFHNEALRNAISSFGSYVHKNQHAALDQFKSIQFYEPEDFLLLDPATQRNLELIKNAHDGSSKNSLFSVVDHAVTAMGSRTIKKWLVRPLVKKELIVQRQEAVCLLVSDAAITQKIEHFLSSIGDLERVVGRIALMRANHYDYVVLSKALEIVPAIAGLLKSRKRVELIQMIAHAITDFSLLYKLLASSLNDDSSKPWIIKPGFDKHLDHLRQLIEHSNQKIMELEQQEQQKTGINSLKIRFNQAHGYYIEITKTHLHAVPEYYTRHQTLVGRERYTIAQLRDLQHEINNAKNDIDAVEKELFDKVKREVTSHISELRKLAYALAHIDALIGFAKVAYIHQYVVPTFNNERKIEIIGGKHPVVQHCLQSAFIANDTHLDDAESVWIITGPNMGGKSTYLRQVALISVLAQCGSLVPARSANLHLLDRIFTRIGAGDNVAEGKSTFLVEMEETASICMQATKNSLVILDEVGRGTSTFDGLAIAQAVVEYIATQVKARCLFATHYHELTLLQETIAHVASYFVASKKTPQGILFLYKVIKGIADGSFGVEVAKLAQLPPAIITRAEDILFELSSQHKHAPIIGAQKIDGMIEQKAEHIKTLQDEIKKLKQVVELNKQLTSIVSELNYDTLSPRQAFDILWSLQSLN